jgi:hypothetical protein
MIQPAVSRTGRGLPRSIGCVLSASRLGDGLRCDNGIVRGVRGLHPSDALNNSTTAMSLFTGRSEAAAGQHLC